MDKVREDPNKKANKITEDRELPWFVRSAATAALKEDAVEAANGLRLLADVFTIRATELTGYTFPQGRAS